MLDKERTWFRRRVVSRNANKAAAASADIILSIVKGTVSTGLPSTATDWVGRCAFALKFCKATLEVPVNSPYEFIYIYQIAKI